MVTSSEYREVELTCGHTSYRVRVGPDSAYVGQPFDHHAEVTGHIPTHPELVDAKLAALEARLAKLEEQFAAHVADRDIDY